MPNGSEVKWCGLCGAWGSHYRVGYPSSEEEKLAEETTGEGLVAIEEVTDIKESSPPSSAFACLYGAGLI